MADTTYSEQEVMNLLYGSAYKTRYSEQEVANLVMGNRPTLKSWQQILNENIGNYGTQWSVQQCLFYNLKTALGLSGNDLQLSEQALLNRAYTAGININTVLNTSGYVPPNPGTSFVGMSPVFSLLGP